jgi:hypothetical protein
MRALYVHVALAVLASSVNAAHAADSPNPNEPCDPIVQEVALPQGVAEAKIVVQAIPCSKFARDRLDSPACCTPGMLTEIKKLSRATLPKVRAAERALADPAAYADILWKHFRVQASDTARIRTIRARLRDIAASIRNPKAVQYFCRDSFDDVCGVGKTRALTENCSTVRPPRLWFCGTYESADYFFGSSWLRTFVHEHAHASCRTVDKISPAGAETYNRAKGDYPPSADRAIRNADSYASFALEF